MSDRLRIWLVDHDLLIAWTAFVGSISTLAIVFRGAWA